MPRRISREPGARIRRLFSSPKRERRCACRSCDREFYRDARQDRVENISREKETGPRARSRLARYVSAALHNGHFHTNSLFSSGATCSTARPNSLRRYFLASFDRNLDASNFAWPPLLAPVQHVDPHEFLSCCLRAPRIARAPLEPQRLCASCSRVTTTLLKPLISSALTRWITARSNAER